MDPAITPPCVHRWRIDEPTGRSSQGVCRYCGETRTFSNQTGDYACLRCGSFYAEHKCSGGWRYAGK
jgi:hypothetical protein